MATGSNNSSHRKRDSVPHHGLKILVVMIGLSLLLHVLSAVNINYLVNSPLNLSQNKAPPVKVRIVEKKPGGSEERQKQIVEAPLEKTKKPEDAKFAGAQDHATDKEMRVKPEAERRKAANAGQFGTQQDQQVQKPTPAQQAQQKVEIQPDSKTKIVDSNGKVSIATGKKQPNSEFFNKMMPSQKDLSGHIDAGYQDYVDENVDIGDRIDINTSEFKYLSYFTTMRKAIELVWNYPLEAAQKGMQGEVGLEFTINKDGSTTRIKVVRSSGYAVLDKAIVEAIRLASPFSPLPQNFGKPRLTVRGSFRYVLTNYAGAH